MNESRRTAVITGASGGIGLAIAQMLLARGWNVVANARSETRLAEAAVSLDAGDRFVSVAGDIAAPATATSTIGCAVESFGGVDMLVNNAGIFLPKPFTEFTSDDIKQQIATNLLGTIHFCQEAARHMIPLGRGQIVNITASVAIKPHSSVPAFLAVLLKGGWNAATRALALELAPHGIRVNAIAPGIIDSPMHSPENHSFLESLQPARRLGRVEEVAGAVLYLAEAEFTNGIVLPVDGGASAGNC